MAWGALNPIGGMGWTLPAPHLHVPVYTCRECRKAAKEGRTQAEHVNVALLKGA